MLEMEDIELKQNTLKSILPDTLKANYLILIEIPIVVILGLLSKFYPGPYREWVNNSLGGVFYVVFFILIFALFARKNRIWLVSLSVLLVTSGLEFLQLWQPPFLQAIRSTFIGRTLIGTTFVPSDFSYYVIGAVLGYILAYNLKKEV